ncbi:hypothetical protein [Mycolicibacter senuensis]|uniref:hypothetical protein n=1 Tax=Mycolicibacter senuensis TaxID=386913 RepID=UPI000DCB0A17|nr:hypothetical protein [Mycolicibacter senuensis]RAV00480.1 hypothetical protein DQP56_09350 [Mycolicibacter senuensis]
MNTLTDRAGAALRAGIGPVAAVLLVVSLFGSAGWVIATVVLAALVFAGYLVMPYLDEQRTLAVRYRKEVRERADRQHHWVLRGDSRGFYGPDGAELMRRIEADSTADSLDDPDDDPPAAAVAYTPEALATLIADKPACWRYAVFASVLVQRRAELQPRLRDQELGYAPSRSTRIHTGFKLAQHLFELLEQLLALMDQIEQLMLSSGFTRMFGDPTDGDSADADAIVHAANRLMDLHERVLTLAERCRGIDTLSDHADVVRDCARVFDAPLEGYRKFIDEFVERVGEFPELLRYARGYIEMDPIMLEVNDSNGLLDKAFAGIRSLAPADR